MLISNKLADNVVVAVDSVKNLDTQIPAVFDSYIVQQVLDQVKSTSFSAEQGEFFTAIVPSGDRKTFITLAGVKGYDGSVHDFRFLGQQVAKYLAYTNPLRVTFSFVDAIATQLNEEQQVFQFLYGLASAMKNSKKVTEDRVLRLPDEIHFLGLSQGLIKAVSEDFWPCIEGAWYAQGIANTAPNMMMPKDLAALCKKELEGLGIAVEVLKDKEIADKGMNLVSAVGGGSKNVPSVITLKWVHKDCKSIKPTVLVGKGLMFDSGGVCLKTRAALYMMGLDMVGAAMIIGTMRTLAIQNTPASVTAVLVCAENALSNTSFRPGDVVTSYSGKTVEVVDTDAEGRLALADVLSYVQESIDADCVVSVATLTYASVVMTGRFFAPFFSNNEALAEELCEASQVAGERVWRFPFADKQDCASCVADIKNVGVAINPRASGSVNMRSGSGAAAAFIKEFVSDEMPWIHLDVLGAAVETKRAGDRTPAYHTYNGYGVHLLYRFAKGRGAEGS